MVIGRRQRVGAAATILGMVCGMMLIPASTAFGGLIIRQQSNGIPGSAQGESTEQTVYVGTGAIRLNQAPNPDRHVIVRFDKKVFWEVDKKLEEYTETRFEWLREQRTDAEQTLESARKKAKERMNDAEFASWLRDKGLREDGKREVTVAKSPWQMRPDGARAQEITVRLNGATQVAIVQTDKYQADYKPPKELVDLYDTGLLPQDIVEKLKDEITHFPVKVWVLVDLYKHQQVIETKVETVQGWEKEDPEQFEVPKHYRKVSKFSEEKVLAKQVTCPVCNLSFDVTKTAHTEKDAAGNKVYFDRDACLNKWLQLHPGG